MKGDSYTASRLRTRAFCPRPPSVLFQMKTEQGIVKGGPRIISVKAWLLDGENLRTGSGNFCQDCNGPSGQIWPKMSGIQHQANCFRPKLTFFFEKISAAGVVMSGFGTGFRARTRDFFRIWDRPGGPNHPKMSGFASGIHAYYPGSCERRPESTRAPQML